MLSFYVYILKCIDGFYYTGHTDNIEKRIHMHARGEIKNFTQKRLPVELVFVQEFGSRHEAIEMEQRIKGWSRKKKEALIEENWDELIRLSNTKKLVLDPSTSSGRTGEGSIEAERRWMKTEREQSAVFNCRANGKKIKVTNYVL